jgi:hypothetical protein
MSVLELRDSQTRGTELDRPRVPVELVPAPPAVEQQPRRSGAGRWFLFLGVPFVLGAFFFALTIVLGATWPMAPAFFLGPLLMIIAYIYLCLSSEANAET